MACLSAGRGISLPATANASSKVAAYGIGALLAASMGIKGIAKAGFMATIMLFAKKAWFVLLLPFIFIGRLFNRKS